MYDNDHEHYSQEIHKITQQNEQVTKELSSLN